MASLKINGLNKVFPSGETALYDVNLEAADAGTNKTSARQIAFVALLLRAVFLLVPRKA